MNAKNHQAPSRGKSKVLLGGWGFGHASLARDFSKVEMSDALKGYLNSITSSFMHHRPDFGKKEFAIPPLSRSTSGRLDYFPFLLYDKVVMDEHSFESLISTIKYSSRCDKTNTFSNEALEKDIVILSKLKDSEVLELHDLPAIVGQSAELLPNFYHADITSTRMMNATKESMALWKTFLQECQLQVYRESAERIVYRLDDILHYFERLLQGELSGPDLRNRAQYGLDSDIYSYHRESIDDVNSTLVASIALGKDEKAPMPIYDWEDHAPYYRVKFSEKIEDIDGRQLASKTEKLFEAFIPYFSIESFDQLMEIREDESFSAVREFVSAPDQIKITDEIIVDLIHSGLRTKAKTDGFRRLVSWLTLPLAFTPIVGSVLQKAGEEVLNKIYEKRVQKELGWKYFFINMRERLSKERIMWEWQNGRGGGGQTYWHIHLDSEICELKSRMRTIETERDTLIRRLKHLEQERTESAKALLDKHTGKAPYLIGDEKNSIIHTMECEILETVSLDSRIEFKNILQALDKGFLCCNSCLRD